MTKTIELISETVRHTKHAFAKIEGYPKKSLRHRYERRKVRGYLAIADWSAEESG